MKSWSEINFLWGSQNLWWARPSIAFWDWDWDFCIVVSKFETDTETFEISLKFWDWYRDFWQVVSKLETGLETTLVSVSLSRPKSRSSLNQSGGWANMPTRFSNTYTSGTECRIDLKPGCKLELFRCPKVYKKNDQFGLSKDPGEPWVPQNLLYFCILDNKTRIKGL